jgi:hypothetical protein
MNMVRIGDATRVGIKQMMIVLPFKNEDPGNWKLDRAARTDKYAVRPKR